MRWKKPASEWWYKLFSTSIINGLSFKKNHIFVLRLAPISVRKVYIAFRRNWHGVRWHLCYGSQKMLADEMAITEEKPFLKSTSQNTREELWNKSFSRTREIKVDENTKNVIPVLIHLPETPEYANRCYLDRISSAITRLRAGISQHGFFAKKIPSQTESIIQ